MKLRRLIAPLYASFMAGEIAIGVAERLSGFRTSEQEMIRRDYPDGITGEVLAQYRQITTQASADKLPGEMFDEAKTFGVDLASGPDQAAVAISVPFNFLSDVRMAVEALRDELTDDNAKRLAGIILARLEQAMGE